MTRDVYLEVTYRHGKPLAAYLRLPRRPGEHAVRSRKMAEGIVVGFGEGNRPIGLAITSPSVVHQKEINAVLAQLDVELLGEDELAPLMAG